MFKIFMVPSLSPSFLYLFALPEWAHKYLGLKYTVWASEEQMYVSTFKVFLTASKQSGFSSSLLNLPLSWTPFPKEPGYLCNHMAVWWISQPAMGEYYHFFISLPASKYFAMWQVGNEGSFLYFPFSWILYYLDFLFWELPFQNP